MSLISEVLKQAGFSMRRYYVDLREWSAKLNGWNQYWELEEEVLIPNGGSVSIDVTYAKGAMDSNDYLITGQGSTSVAIYLADLNNFNVGSSGYLADISSDGVLGASTPYDGNKHTIAAEARLPDTRIKYLGTRYNFERFSDAALSDLIIKDETGAVVYHNTLGNKAEGAVQSPRVGDVSARLVNYTEHVWLDVTPTYYAELDGISQYWELNEGVLIDPSSDFRIEVDISFLNDSGQAQGLLGSGNPEHPDFLRTLPSTQTASLQAKLGGAYPNGAPFEEYLIGSGTPRTLIFERKGETINMGAGGFRTSRDSSSYQNEPFYFDKIGQYSSSEFAGTIYAVRVWENGNMKMDLKLDKQNQQVQYDKLSSNYATLINYTDAVWKYRTPIALANLDGISQYWELSSSLDLLEGDLVTFAARLDGSMEGAATILGKSARYSAILRIREDGHLEQNGASSIHVDGIPYAAGSDMSHLYDNKIHTFTFTLGADAPVRSIGAAWADTETTSPVWRWKGAISEFSIARGGEVVVSLELNNRLQEGYQLRLAGVADATLVNYTDAVWSYDE